ncbi:MAG: phosphatidylserine decarboxylase [Ancalomicrobiaceae bacterium]|nr:phosphatidylserine decarboxylase [Ancalomicrobiaceae bacterium]
MQSIISSITKSIPPINREGYPFILIALIITVIVGHFSTSLFWILVGLTIWVVAFFRDPVRVTPVGAGLVVSPADGKVSQVGLAEPPAELNLPDASYLRISIFMNVFNCHVNRAPAGGLIEAIAYRPGKFLNAELDKASEDNERNGLVIALDSGVKIGVVQIAGLVARRIVSWKKEGDTLISGERFGMIRFGSRLDVYLPAETMATVGVGQTAVAGETILADLSVSGRPPVLVRVS